MRQALRAGVPPRAEYHPDAGWLRDHGRNPKMSRGVEFTDIAEFDRETLRMPPHVAEMIRGSASTPADGAGTAPGPGGASPDRGG